jgi:hypothetical protein
MLQVMTEGQDALLFIAKTFSFWELTFATDSDNSESSSDSSSSDNEDSDLTDTSELALAQPLAE